MKKINISKIRKKLDKVDIKLLKIIKERALLVDQVLKLKKNKSEVVDKKRINFILKRIKSHSKRLNLDPEISVNIWKIMIKNFIKYEYKKFKRK
jgi:chorismate mutase